MTISNACVSRSISKRSISAAELGISDLIAYRALRWESGQAKEGVALLLVRCCSGHGARKCIVYGSLRPLSSSDFQLHATNSGAQDRRRALEPVASNRTLRDQCADTDTIMCATLTSSTAWTSPPPPPLLFGWFASFLPQHFLRRLSFHLSNVKVFYGSK